MIMQANQILFRVHLSVLGITPPFLWGGVVATIVRPAPLLTKRERVPGSRNTSTVHAKYIYILTRA